MIKPRILIAGIGNIFLGDDAFGSEVARSLARQSWPDAVRVEDFGIRGFDLAFALLDGYDLTILIDAVPRGGKPGTLYKIEPDLAAIDDFEQPDMIVETHGMNPVKVLAMVKAMGGSLEKIVLIGCEPAPLTSDEGEMGLTLPVQAALREASRMVEEIVAEAMSSSEQAAVADV